MGAVKHLALALLLWSSAATAQPVDDLERDDSLALSIAWRLQAANAAYCPRVAPATGIQLEDLAVFEDPALARATYRVTGPIFIGALAAGSPGAAAGLKVNATVTAIDGQPLDAIPAPPRRDRFARLHRIAAMLDTGASHSLTLADGSVVTVAATPVCHVAVTVDDGTNDARATRDAIRLGRVMLDAAHGQQDVIAALIAHEMAHAVLDHQARLVAANRSPGIIRRTEREADRLSAWLLANAKYRVEAALDLQRTIVAHHLGLFDFDPLHGGWRERARLIAAEIAVLKAAPDADWAHRFRKELD